MINLDLKYTKVTDSHGNDMIYIVSPEWGEVSHRWMKADVNGYSVKFCNIPKNGQSTQMTQEISNFRIQENRCIAFLRDPVKRLRSQLFNCGLSLSRYINKEYDSSKNALMHMIPQKFFVDAYPYEILEFLDVTQMNLVFDQNTFVIQNPANYDHDFNADWEENFEKHRPWFEDTYQADIELYNTKILGV